MEDLTGKQFGQYQIVEPLGQGGMATVYKAYQPSMERFVALKILPRHFASDPDFVRRFQTEARVIASLEHPNILPVHDFGEADGFTYLVMRFVSGQPLNHLLTGSPLPLPRIHKLIAQIAAALDYAHSRGIIHRDVKPANVLIDEHGNCLLSDFGLAKMLLASSQHTASGAFLGTPTYASPEQCLGRSDIDQRSDVYSLGVMLYEMAAGRPPYDADTPMGVVVKHVYDPLPLPRQINPALSETVQNVILKALSKEPEGRFSSAGELAQALAGAIRTGDLPTRAISVPTPGGRPSRKRLPAWGWAAGFLLGILLLTGAGLLGWGLLNFANQASGKATHLPVGMATFDPADALITPGATASPTPAIPTNRPVTTASPPGEAFSTPLPTLPPESAQPHQAFALPISEPYDIVALPGGKLQVLYDRKLVTLEMVEAENRFRAGEQIDFIQANSLDWDAAHNQYWVVHGASFIVDRQVSRVDASGTILATYTVPDTIDYYPRFAAWDGASLWVDNEKGTLYKLQAEGSGEMQIIDSYALSISRYGSDRSSGLAWDGNSLWLLLGDALFKLDLAAQPVCSIQLADPFGGVTGPAWYEWLGLTWDGQFLWVMHSGENKAYRIDPHGCE